MDGRRGHDAIAVPVAAALTAPWTLAWASAQERTFTRSRSRGEPGTVIAVAGTGCAEGGQPYEKAVVRLYYRGDPEFSPERAKGTYRIEDDGTFDGTLTVPRTAPPGRYLLTATCFAADMAFPLGDSDFTGDSPVPTITPTVTPAPTSPTSRAPTRTVSASPTRQQTTRPAPSRAVRPSRSARPSPSVTSQFPSPATTAPVALPPIAYDGPREQRTPAVAVAFVLLLVNAAGVAKATRRVTR